LISYLKCEIQCRSALNVSGHNKTSNFYRITEENFWRNYFYRVSLIIQAGDLGTLGTDDAFGKRDDDDDGNV
jgi:hypothetical protein